MEILQQTLMQLGNGFLVALVFCAWLYILVNIYATRRASKNSKAPALAVRLGILSVNEARDIQTSKNNDPFFAKIEEFRNDFA